MIKKLEARYTDVATIAGDVFSAITTGIGVINHTYLSSLRTTTTIPIIVSTTLPYRTLGKYIRTSKAVCARLAFFVLTFDSANSQVTSCARPVITSRLHSFVKTTVDFDRVQRCHVQQWPPLLLPFDGDGAEATTHGSAGRVLPCGDREPLSKERSHNASRLIYVARYAVHCSEERKIN